MLPPATFFAGLALFRFALFAGLEALAVLRFTLFAALAVFRFTLFAALAFLAVFFFFFGTVADFGMSAPSNN